MTAVKELESIKRYLASCAKGSRKLAEKSNSDTGKEIHQIYAEVYEDVLSFITELEESEV